MIELLREGNKINNLHNKKNNKINCLNKEGDFYFKILTGSNYVYVKSLMGVREYNLFNNQDVLEYKDRTNLVVGNLLGLNNVYFISIQNSNGKEIVCRYKVLKKPFELTRDGWNGY